MLKTNIMASKYVPIALGLGGMIAFGAGYSINKINTKKEIENMKWTHSRELTKLRNDIKREDSTLKLKYKIIGGELPSIVDKYNKNKCDTAKSNECYQYKTLLHYMGIIPREQIADIELLAGLLTNELALKLSAVETIKSWDYGDLETEKGKAHFKNQHKIFCNGTQQGWLISQCEYEKLVLDALKILEKTK